MVLQQRGLVIPCLLIHTRQLQNQIDQVNTFIQQYNTTLQARSPLLNHHLKARKQVRRGKGKPHKNVLIFKNFWFLDGFLMYSTGLLSSEVPLILLVLCLDKVSV
jgi:hypothetical protein